MQLRVGDQHRRRRTQRVVQFVAVLGRHAVDHDVVAPREKFACVEVDKPTAVLDQPAVQLDSVSGYPTTYSDADPVGRPVISSIISFTRPIIASMSNSGSTSSLHSMNRSRSSAETSFVTTSLIFDNALA